MTSVGLASEVTHKAHDINRKRTHDVRIEESVDFTGLCLSPNVLSGLKAAGFVRPSPIQLKAIPLGRCGLDLIVQAKSGTGKTCVFTVIALENLIQKSRGLQVLVLAPTREIAMQIAGVVKSIGSHMAGLSCHVFIGGLPLAEDKRKLQNCQIAVGTPGRVKQLIEENVLGVDSIRLFILDEADKLLEDSFQDQINWIFSALPENKQILALSATYPEYLAQHLQAYMRNPTFVRLNVSDPALFGIRQYYEEVKFHPLPQVQFDEKVKHLTKLLSSVTFQQCLIFSNYQMRAQSLADVLISKGWPAAYISGSQDQYDRIDAMDKLKTMQCRILISTDLTSRGIDVEHVNLVVNLDLPWDHETYLHRIGRAGRFGSYGAAVSYVAAGKEWNSLMAIAEKCNTTVKELPDQPPEDLARSSGYTDLDNLVTVEKVVTQAGGDASKLIPWPKTLKRDELNLEFDTELSDGLRNTGLELILQNESTTDSDLTPTTFMKDMENYSIHQEFGPEENGMPDWSGALRDVYSLVKEIKDLYVSEKAAVKDVKPPKNGKDSAMKRAIMFDDLVQDYEKFLAEDKDDFEDWLEKFVPDRIDCHSLCLSKDEVKDLIADINEQSERLVSMEDEVVGETEFSEFNEEGHESYAAVTPSSVRSESEDNDSIPDIAIQHSKTHVDVLEPQKKSPNLYNGRVRMGIGSMLQHLRGGEELSSNIKESVITKDDCCSGGIAEQTASPAEYGNDLHDLSLPEVVDFSEYDQSYLYFKNLDQQQGFSNDCDYEAQDGRQDYESVPSPQLDEGREYGEEMANEETVIGDDPKNSAFRWVQETQNDPERTDSSKQSGSCRAKKEKRRKSGSSSSRGSHVRSSCDEQFSDCRSASVSSKGHRGRYSKGESLYPNPGSAYPLSKDKNPYYPWYPYVGYPPFPYMSPYGPFCSSAQYFAAAATVHDQWSKYYQKMFKAAHSNDSLSRIYKMQKDYIKFMSHQS